MNKRVNEEIMIEIIQNDMIGKAFTENEHLGVVQRIPTPRGETVFSLGVVIQSNVQYENPQTFSRSIFQIPNVLDTKLNHFVHSPPLIIFTAY